MHRAFWLSGMILIGTFSFAGYAAAATLFSIESITTLNCGTLLYAGTTYAFDSNAMSVAGLAIAWLIALLIFWPWRALRHVGQTRFVRWLSPIIFGLSMVNALITLFIFPHGQSMVWVVSRLLAWVSAAPPAAACLGPGVPNGYWALNFVMVGIYLVSFIVLLVFQWRLRRSVLATSSPISLPTLEQRPAIALICCISMITLFELTILILNRLVASGRYDRFFFS